MKILNLSRRLAALLILLAGVLSGQGPAHRPPISPRLVGNNVWHNPDDAAWKVASGAGLQTVRIGGGAFDRKMPSNDELMDWCRRIRAMNAEPMIQISQYLTPEQAAGIVRYFNGEQQMNIQFWNIGNETWLRRKRPPIETVAEMVAAYVKPIASAMKSADSTIQIFVCDECDYFDALYKGLSRGPFDVCGKDENGRYYIDGFSWHRYVSGDRDWVAANAAQDIRIRAQKCKALIDSVNVTHHRTGRNALQWGIGEFNLENRGYEGPSTIEGSGVHSFVNGQFFAEVLGICMEYQATYCCTWSIFEHGGSRSGTDYSFIDGEGLTPRPTYRHMEMIAKHFSGGFAPGITCQENLRAFGCRDRDKICVLILNMETEGGLSYTLRLDNGPSGADCPVNVDVEIPAEYTGVISNQTTQVLIFDGEGRLISKLVYGLGQAQKGEAPEAILN